MTICNRLSIALFTSGIGLVLIGKASAEITGENQIRITQLLEMTQELKSSGVRGFITRCPERVWTAPKIFSAWHIARMLDDPEGQKKVEEAKSNLGLELARQLSVVAKNVRETKEIPKLEQASDTLFATAKWIGTEVGYGNLFLQDRAYDIASVAAVKFMADLNYPMEKAEGAMKRFDWSWCDSSNRRKVLFEESNGTHFRATLGADDADALKREWKEGVTLAIERTNVEKMPDLAIFVIDDQHPDESLVVPETSWYRRAHFMIGEGNFGSVNLRNLESLRVFRKRYGIFPTKPVKYVKGKTESDIQAAFWELSWESPYGVGAAYLVYEQYINGSLADKGWQDLRDRSRVGPLPTK